MPRNTKTGAYIAAGAKTAGGFAVPGTTVSNVDHDRMLRDVWETNIISASRREMDHAKRKGYSISEREARDTVIAQYEGGAVDVLPQFHSMKMRREGAQ